MLCFNTTLSEAVPSIIMTVILSKAAAASAAERLQENCCQQPAAIPHLQLWSFKLWLVQTVWGESDRFKRQNRAAFVAALLLTATLSGAVPSIRVNAAERLLFLYSCIYREQCLSYFTERWNDLSGAVFPRVLYFYIFIYFASVSFRYSYTSFGQRVFTV